VLIIKGGQRAEASGGLDGNGMSQGRVAWW
jgi:hypothetical protein